MSNLHISVLILSAVFLTVSCNSKETSANQLDDLANEIETNGKDYTDEDWESAAEEYEQIEADIEDYRSEYTEAELREIGRKKGRCLAAFTKYATKRYKEDVEEAMHEATGIMQGFSEGFNEE